MRATLPWLLAAFCGACDLATPGPPDGGEDAAGDRGSDAAADAGGDAGPGDAPDDGGGDGAGLVDAAAPAGVRVREAFGAMELLASRDGRWIAARDSVGPDGLGRLVVAATAPASGGSAAAGALSTGVAPRSFALSDDGQAVAWTRHTAPGAQGSVHIASTSDLGAARKLGDGVYPRNLHFVGNARLLWLGEAREEEGLVRGTLHWVGAAEAPAALASATPWLWVASRDARWLAFASQVDPFSGLGRLLALDTAAASPATVAASVTSIAIAPDGSRIAWIVPAQAGAEVAVDALPPTGLAAPLGAGELPVFSPDGARLAYRREGALWVWNAGAPSARAVASGMAAAWPSWSPDGARALFFRTWQSGEKPQTGDLYAVDPAAESPAPQLVAANASPLRTDSPDRRWSALFAKGALVLVEWTESGPVATTFGSAVAAGDASFSPDSTHVAYLAGGGLRLRALADGAEVPVAAGVTSGRYAFAGADLLVAVQAAGASGAGDLVARALDGGETRLLAAGASEVRALGGRRVAYIIPAGPHGGLWVVDVQ